MIALTLLGLALLRFGPARTAQAHGGGTLQLANAAAGSYRVSAWTEPEPPRAGTLHLSVAVSAPRPGAAEAEAGDVVLDAAVRVQVQPLDGAGEMLTAQASRQDSANKFLYEADMELPEAGQWRVEVQVEGPAGAGVAGFDLQVLPAAQSPLAATTGRLAATTGRLAALGWPLWAGLGLAVALGVWLVVGFPRPAADERRTTDDRRPTTKYHRQPTEGSPHE
jgi:hypothetical protein